MKKREALKTYVNQTADASALSASLQADLNLVASAYESASVSLIELEKAFSRIDSIASQEGTGAAVKAFRDIAAAQKDIASTLIALRTEARTTIHERLRADAAATPPAPASDSGLDRITPPAKIFPPRATLDDTSHPGDPGIDAAPAPITVIESNSAPAADIPDLNNNYDLSAIKIGAAPDGAAALHLTDFLKASTK